MRDHIPLNYLLREKAKLKDQAKAILDAAMKDNRDLTAAEDSKLAELKAGIDEFNNKIALRERELEQERSMGHPPSSPPAGQQFNHAHEGRPGGPVSDRSYRGMWAAGNPAAVLDAGGFQGPEEFFRALHAGRADHRLDALQIQAMNEGESSSGAFAVPAEFTAWLLDQSLENEIVRPRAQVWPMKSKTRKVPGWDASNHQSGLFGGFVAYWENESTTLTESEGKLRMIELAAKKLTCLTPVSNELLSDGLSFENQLGGAIAKTMGWFIDYACLRGTGAGQPLGILNDPALITVSKESGQPAKTVVYDNVTKMFARLAPQCFANAVWLANQTLIPQLLTMTMEIGTGGVHFPVLKEESGRFFMFGKEVIFTEKLPSLGAANCIVLVDLSQYAVGLRKDMTLDKSAHAGFTRDETYYRAILRADGQGTWDKAITPKAGDSLSWIVGLEATA